VGTNLSGNALTWYRNIRLEHETSPNPGLATSEAFFRMILYTFDDPNSVNNSRDQLSRIKQGRESCLAYSTRFRNIAIETGYNEVAKVALFRNGLNDSLKDALANIQSTPEHFEEFAKLAITLDNRQYQRRVEYRKVHEVSTAGPQPMQLDTITTPGLSLKKELKEYRMKNGLCLYCGERGHLLKECGKRPKNGEPRQEKRIS
jgi:ribosomal protein L32